MSPDVWTIMMYLLTEEEYFHLSESRNDIAKLKVALKKECDELSKTIDAYKCVGAHKIVSAYAERLNQTIYIIDKYL